MNKTKLVFSESGTTVSILFGNGKESLEFESKEEAIFAIHDCFKKGKITPDEVENFVKEITLSKKLPDRDSKLLSLLPLLLLSATLSALIKSEEFEKTMHPQEKIADPRADICNCGDYGPHGYIYDGEKKVTPPFQFKSEGFYFVDKLLEQEAITEGDAAGLNTVIHLMKLPENPSLN